MRLNIFALYVFVSVLMSCGVNTKDSVVLNETFNSNTLGWIEEN